LPKHLLIEIENSFFAIAHNIFIPPEEIKTEMAIALLQYFHNSPLMRDAQRRLFANLFTYRCNR
jgi:DUF1365 family protein